MIRRLRTLVREIAFTEEDFFNWDKKKQLEWVKQHPDSKFAKVYAERNKTLTKEEKQKLAEEKFNQLMETKSESDRHAFMEARKHGIAIPPAWVNVTFNKEPKDGVIAVGTDAKGRKQRLEDAEYRAGKIREKHERIQSNLEPKFDNMVKTLKKEAEKSVEAQVLYLITQTAFRIGGEGDGRAREKAYGASTLLGKHVTVKGNTVTFDFIGKEGVKQHHVVKDPLIAKFVSNVEPEERIFKTNETKIRNYWKSLGGEKVHDIRSLLATRLAKQRLSELIPPAPKTMKELLILQKDIGEKASQKLGNRPSEALNTYIDASIFPEVKE